LQQTKFDYQGGYPKIIEFCRWSMSFWTIDVDVHCTFTTICKKVKGSWWSCLHGSIDSPFAPHCYYCCYWPNAASGR
jgi:hypothetical protein